LEKLQPSGQTGKTVLGLKLNTILPGPVSQHTCTQHTDFPTESAPQEVQARAAALTALQLHWFPRFLVFGISGVSLPSSPQTDVMPTPAGAQTTFAGYD